MRKLISYLKNAIVVVLVLFAIWVFAGDIIEVMPKNAEVMVDDSLKIYYSPMYFYDYRTKGWEKLRLTTYADIKIKGYEADEKCRKLGTLRMNLDLLYGGGSIRET